MVRAPCCSKVGLMRGPWSSKEDALLTDYIQKHGEGQWRSLPKKAGLLRCGKSCRLRWMNYLRPGIKRGNITEDEEDLIVRLHGLLGNRWSLIAGRLPGRTDNEIKNYWNTYLLKKLQNSGAVDPNHPKKKSKKVNVDDGSRNPKNRSKKKYLGKGEDVMITEGGRDNNKVVESVSDKVKVYVPKPTRVCSVLPRTQSLDSLASGAASSGGEAWDMAAPEMRWDPAVFAMGGADDYYGSLVPLLTSCGSMSSDDVDMLDMVYDEYLQLL